MLNNRRGDGGVLKKFGAKGAKGGFNPIGGRQGWMASLD